ncbi:hypothetical protein [Roseateles microcysteis]|uniref:hypothetical protein n=1 Tax=Roseateles microcysteis TaxID=3119057 RepID=UPI002FE66217
MSAHLWTVHALHSLQPMFERLMMKRGISTFTVVVALLSGCATQPPRPPVGAPELEGFEAFATPRTFDGPGTVYRIDSDGKRFPVAEIVFRVRSGEEAIPKYKSRRDLSLNQFLEALGASAEAMPASVKVNLSNVRSANIEATTGQRQYVQDNDVEPTLLAWADKTDPKAENEYYLIREVIATPALTYKVDKQWLVSLTVDVKALKAAGYKGEAKDDGVDSLEMDRRFDKPMNVWYKAERISFRRAMGAGPGSPKYTVDRKTLKGVL